MSRRNSVFFKSTAILALFSFTFLLWGGDFAFAQEAAVVVPSHTPVTIRINEDVSSKTKSSGSSVQASVAMDVVIDGKIVIKAGAPCNAIVTSASKAGIVGGPGRILVTIQSVTAVDGSSVALTGATQEMEGKSQVVTAVLVTVLCCILGLLIKGKEGVIPSGTQVTGYTASQMQIKL